jgi:hypothetical protein
MAILAGQRIRALDFAGYAHVYDFANVTGLTPPANGFQTVTPAVGVAFVAPTSGAVMCEFGGRIRANSGALRVYAACQLRTGGVINSGVVVEEADSDRALEGQASSGGIVQVNGTAVRVHTGLTPGNLYHFVWQVGRGDTGATVEVYSRLITVTPWHGV